MQRLRRRLHTVLQQTNSMLHLCDDTSPGQNADRVDSLAPTVKGNGSV